MSFDETTKIPHEVDDSIHKFSSHLSLIISQMNQNIDAIKAFMVNQNVQNGAFLNAQVELNKRLSNIEQKVEKNEFG